MKKFILSIIMLAFAFLAQAQVSATSAMTAATGTVDSSATEYVTARITSPGCLSIQTVITKTANTGSTVAGYCLLQGSLDGTNFVNVPTWKTVAYGSVPQTAVFNTDTFTLANTTAAQTKVWVLHGVNGVDDHPFVYYRIAVVMTTTKVTATGTYLLRKL